MADHLETAAVIGSRLRQLRERQERSIAELAREAGVSPATVTRIESGLTANTALSTLIRISEALATPLHVLTKVSIGSQEEPPLSRTEVICQSAAMRAVMKRATEIARRSVTVLITGENGTGKSLLAEKIHELSGRSGRFFVVNCASLPEPLADAELFGHAKGAFTDAIRDQAGAFEAASGGTIVLDEIGDLSPVLQGKLLNAIEKKEAKRLGDNKIRHFDVRIIATTNRDLGKMIQEGAFRLDLYYRLNQYQIRILPLRERPEDIKPLCEFFMAFDARRLESSNKTLAPHALSLLEGYAWPGNVRELESTLNLLMFSADGDVIDAPSVRSLLDERAEFMVSAQRASTALQTEAIPYYFGPAVQDPSRFYGRQREMSELLRLVRQARAGQYWHVALIGDHRVGKSSLLRMLNLTIPEETRSLSTFVDMAGLSSHDFFRSLVRKIAELVFGRSRDTGFVKRLKKASDLKEWQRILGPELAVDVLGVFKAKWKTSDEQNWSSFKAILDTLWERLLEFGSYDSIVVILDEVSACSRWENCADVLKNWRSTIQALQGYNFLVADAYPLYKMSEDHWSPFFNVFHSTRLRAMSDEDSELLITEPARIGGVSYQPMAVDKIKRLTGRKPYYIQVLCTSIFELLVVSKTTTNVTRDIVELAVDRCLDHLNEHFASMWGKFTDVQKEFLVSRVNGKAFELNRHDGFAALERDANQLRLLREREVIDEDDQMGGVEPLLEMWLKRSFPDL